MKKLITVAVTTIIAATTLSACGESDDKEVTSYVKSVRANHLAKSYDDDTVKVIYGQLCDLKMADRDSIMDNYSKLTKDDRRELVDLTATHC